MSPLNSWPLLAAALVLMQIFTLAACESDAQRVREMNATERMQTQVASGTPAPSPTLTPISAEIETTEIQDGDCINSTIEEGVEIETVVIVPCSGSWQYRVLNSFTAPGSGGYPGEDYFSRLAHERCDRHYFEFLYPIRESWAVMDRIVNCLQPSFGLSVSDRPKLDRLVSIKRLNVWECFNEAPETDDLLVELVDCSSDWQYRVLNSFTVAGSGGYPGEDYFSQLAYERCDRHYFEFLYPIRESWAAMDRIVNCLQQSFGLSVADRPKLDRLVAAHRLRVGECFNQAPEIGNLLVEVVDCSRDWESQVVTIFSVPRDYSLPGYAYFQEQAAQHCHTPLDYFYYPDDHSWRLGDRDIICVRAS